MTTLRLISTDGIETEIPYNNGDTLMQTITGAGASELLALCGGVCSCATCHVYVDESLLADLPAMSVDEQDLLELSEHRESNSRLSCQLRLNDAFAAKTITIAPAE